MNELIRQDGFINATLLCKKGGKRFAKWNENKSTKIFLSKLQEHLSTPIDELVIIKQGGNNQTQGTWIHPIIATNLAQWISPEFSIKTSQWIEEWKQYKNNKDLYKQELKNIKPNHNQDSTEKEIQLKLHKKLGGEMEQKTKFGYIDLLTNTEIIEIKNGDNWKHGLGQLLVYSKFYPTHTKRLHLFNIENDEEINDMCKEYNIFVSYE